MDSHERILVLGGGIFGSSAALALARRGYAKVTVADQSTVGSGSTALAAGLISLHTWNEADARLIHRTRRLVEALVAWGGEEGLPAARAAWHPVGGVTIGSEARLPDLERVRRRITSLNEPVRVVDHEEASRLAPAYQFAAGEWVLWTSADGYCEATDLMELIRAHATRLGVRFREQLRAARVLIDGGRATGVEWVDQRTERADRVLVAGGPWTKRLLLASGVRLPVAAYRTQLAVIDLPTDDPLPVLHDTIHHFYARRESDTRILAGDGTELREFEPDAFNVAADSVFIETTASRVVQRFVDGPSARYRRGWAGLCVGTPDRRPLAGPATGVEDLYVLTGDNGFGLMRGLALGEVVAATIAGDSDEAAPSLRLDRFGKEPPSSFPLKEGFSYPD